MLQQTVRSPECVVSESTIGEVSKTHGPLATAALEAERAQNAELRKRIEDLADKAPDAGGGTRTVNIIPRPKGTAGTQFSIQEAMGLSGTIKKYETYKAIQV